MAATDEELLTAVMERLARALADNSELARKVAHLEEKQGCIRYGQDILIFVDGVNLGRGVMEVSSDSTGTIFKFTTERP